MRKVIVMVVDNQPFFRAGVRQALADQGAPEILDILECEPGEEGQEAMRQVAAQSPDIVIMDIGYPFLKGLDLCKKVSRNFPATKVVMLSTNPDDDDEELFEVIKTGAVAYLHSKDLTSERLIDIIRRASGGEYPINDSVSMRPRVAWRVLRQFQDMASMGRAVEDITTPLTSKEIQILSHIAEGNSNKRIANILGISEQTIKNHVSAILRKLNANDRAHAVMLAVRNGWISIQAGHDGGHAREHVASANVIRDTQTLG